MNISNHLKKYFYPHQHPETALRYLPIVELLTKNGWENSKILEIGSGSYGITPYLKKPITGIDFDFSEPETPLLKQVKGMGEKLPFQSGEFEIVILSDVLEHVPSGNRQSVLKEAIRVASKVVIISGPFGEEAFKHDLSLSKIITHRFLKEHIQFGLPDKELITQLKNTKIKNCTMVGEYLNVTVRKMIMRLFALNSKFAYYLYLKGLMPLVPIFLKCNMKPCYRMLFTIELVQ